MSKTGSGATTAHRAFLEEDDLLPEITTQTEPRWAADRGMVVISVAEPIGTDLSTDGQQ